MADRIQVLYVGRAARFDVDDLSVREAASVAAALEDVDQVDCVVSAQQLEDGTGLELLRAVREDHPDLPFILYPAAEAADERVASEAISAGVTDYYRQDGTGEGELAYRITEAVDGTRRAVGRTGARRIAEDAETVLGRVSDAFFALDESWRFTHLNERAAELIDVDADAIVGRNVWEAFPEATERAFYDEYHRAMESQERVSFTEHYPPLDAWFEVTAYPSETGLSVYFRDITERVERERELESTAEAFHGLYDAVSDPEASFEQTLDRLLDLGREYLDVDVGMLNHIEDEVEILERVRGDHPQLREGDEVPLERAYCRFTLDSGDHWSVHDATEVLPGDPAYETFGLDCYVGGVVTVGGERYGTLCFVDDEPREPFSEVETALVDLLAQWVSFELERRALENERERLAFLNRLVRHDLLNDLNVVHARARLLDEQVAESERPHLDLVLDRTEEMIDLVGTVRSLMRAIVEDPQLESVDLEAVLREEIGAAERTADHAEIRLVDPADVAVQADELLGQVFENLLGNAVEHGSTSPRSQAHEDAVEHGSTTPLDGRQPNPLVEVSVETDAEHVTVHVADDGPGMPDDLKETALERGAKAGESPGTGVGLYLVSQLVDAYGGEVAIEDNEPTGTVVSVTLPRA